MIEIINVFYNLLRYVMFNAMGKHDRDYKTKLFDQTEGSTQLKIRWSSINVGLAKPITCLKNFKGLNRLKQTLVDLHSLIVGLVRTLTWWSFSLKTDFNRLISSIPLITNGKWASLSRFYFFYFKNLVYFFLLGYVFYLH